MMKDRSILLACLLPLLFGCTTHYEWRKDGSDQTRTDVDVMACRTEMSRYAGAQTPEVFDQCMSARGYDKQVKSYSIW